MNKYKVIYYVVAITLLVSVCLLIGTNLDGLISITATNLFGPILPSYQ